MVSSENIKQPNYEYTQQKMKSPYFSLVIVLGFMLILAAVAIVMFYLGRSSILDEQDIIRQSRSPISTQQ
jgi:flagellar basal body-associated protein FliL